jgi:transcription initiation factor TFIIIB Brf1 subunit/transcription initiation factor TFIIB
MSHNNYTTIETACPYCKTQPITRDNIRQETYCPKCGLVILDTTIPNIMKEIRTQKQNYTETRFKEIWKTIKFTKKKEKKRGGIL